jgi:3-carboxy-cis,cis-muconate cycloisomerase
MAWVAVPESFVIAVGALYQADFALAGLVVNQKQMLTNLYSTRGLIVAEAVMMGLAPHLGRGKAHDAVYAACKESIENDTSLLEALQTRTEITEKISSDQLASLCDAKNYLGSCGLMVDEVLAASR